MNVTCPQCGSTRLKIVRPPWAKLFLGLLAPRNRLRCSSCQQVFKV